MPDNVNQPQHYRGLHGLEVIDIIRAALGPEGFRAYCCGNAIKYRMRAGKKGDAAECLAKADVYERWANQASDRSTDWAPWPGGATPSWGGPMEVRFKDGGELLIQARGELSRDNWHHVGSHADVVAVRYLRPDPVGELR